jgi:hypothetical protein
MTEQGKRRKTSLTKGWTAIEDQIVILWSTGHFSETALAEKFNLPAPYVKQVLKDPRAETTRMLVRDRIRENLVQSVEGELTYLASKAVQVIKQTLEAEISPLHQAKGNQDKVALAVLKGMGYLGDGENRGAGGLQLSPEQHSALLKAIEKSDRVAQTTPFFPESGPVKDAELVKEQ